MNLFLDFTSLIFLVIAIVVFWRLRSVLGTRTGNEKPPRDPFARTKPPEDKAGDNVITLPRPQRPAADDPDATAGIDAVAPPGSALNAALRTLVSADRSFDPAAFLSGAEAAYEMIVSAFAAGDKAALKPLLSSEVYDRFAGAIAERSGRGETMDFTFVGVDKADIVEAQVSGGTAQVTVRFTSQMISVTRDRAGAVIDGDAARVATVTDVWTFARDIRSDDPNWKLSATDIEG